MKPVLTVQLLAINLSTCERCVPAAFTVQQAVELLHPVADRLGVTLAAETVLVQTKEEALKYGIRTSPTIRINGHDIEPDVQESPCGSCCDIAGGEAVDCREWNYRGEVFSAVPLPMLLEVLMWALLQRDEMPPVTPEPLTELPENLARFFAGAERNNAGGDT